jgi:hypothetical protein
MTIGKRSPGDKGLSARDWNKLATAYNSGMVGGLLQSPSEDRNPVVVQVRNDTGDDLGKRAIVGLGDSVISSSSNARQWKEDIVLSADTPEAGTHDNCYGVLLDSIPDGGIGRAVVAGATQVLLNVAASTDTHASIADGETDYLTTGTSGTARIVWKASGTGQRLGIVLLNATGGVMLGKTDEAIAKGTTGTVSIYAGESGTETDTGNNVECKNRFADVDTGKWVAFTLIGSFHYLIAAECD